MTDENNIQAFMDLWGVPWWEWEIICTFKLNFFKFQPTHPLTTAHVIIIDHTFCDEINYPLIRRAMGFYLKVVMHMIAKQIITTNEPIPESEELLLCAKLALLQFIDRYHIPETKSHD